MVIFTTRQERELLDRLRLLGTTGDPSMLSAEVVALKTQIADLEIAKSKLAEKHERDERELRHMVGLEKKRQAVELEQATREAKLSVREENLAHERKQFEAQLAFNTERFTTMEKYLKEMLSDILKRLPDVSLRMKSNG